jgi:hypothetical protein
MCRQDFRQQEPAKSAPRPPPTLSGTASEQPTRFGHGVAGGRSPILGIKPICDVANAAELRPPRRSPLLRTATRLAGSHTPKRLDKHRQTPRRRQANATPGRRRPTSNQLRVHRRWSALGELNPDAQSKVAQASQAASPWGIGAASSPVRRLDGAVSNPPNVAAPTPARTRTKPRMVLLPMVSSSTAQPRNTPIKGTT